MHLIEHAVQAWSEGLDWGYQKLLIIKILALYSVIDKAIFTKISTLQNLLA